MGIGFTAGISINYQFEKKLRNKLMPELREQVDFKNVKPPITIRIDEHLKGAFDSGYKISSKSSSTKFGSHKPIFIIKIVCYILAASDSRQHCSL